MTFNDDHADVVSTLLNDAVVNQQSGHLEVVKSGSRILMRKTMNAECDECAQHETDWEAIELSTDQVKEQL